MSPRECSLPVSVWGKKFSYITQHRMNIVHTEPTGTAPIDLRDQLHPERSRIMRVEFLPDKE
jgi:hypothetical protein